MHGAFHGVWPAAPVRDPMKRKKAIRRSRWPFPFVGGLGLSVAKPLWTPLHVVMPVRANLPGSQVRCGSPA